MFCGGGQSLDAVFQVPLVVCGGAFVDVDLAPPQHAEDPLRQLTGRRTHRDIGAQTLRHAPIVGTERGLTATDGQGAAMRSAAPTRAVVLPGFLRVATGLPPLVGLCGARPTWATNCFSVAKPVKFGPYSLSTTLTVSTPSASIVVRSTLLRRRSAGVISASCRSSSRSLQARLDRVIHLQRLRHANEMIDAPMTAQVLGDLGLALATAVVAQGR